MEGDLCPGPDGFNFKFIKHFWTLFREDFFAMLSEFYLNATLPKAVFSYFITLIPKVASPHQLCDFRPISLLGYMYVQGGG
jgi:hypothetical protein